MNAESLEKVVRLLELLDQVNRHHLLASKLALKGGTALNMCFGKPPRLSVDLDFNYVGAVDRTTMLAERPDVERAIESVGHASRYAVQTSPEAHAGRKWFFSYTNHTGRSDRIEVDVSYTNRVPLTEPSLRQPWSPDGTNWGAVLVSSSEELVAGKLRALIDRVAARDVFDSTWVLGLVPEDRQPLFRRLFVLFSGTLSLPLTSYSVDRIDQVTQEEIDARLVPMLFGNRSVARDDIVAKAKESVAPLLVLDEAEREYCAAINRGDYRPDLLLADWPEVLEPLKHHPALLWKAENARKKRSG